jgi:DNA-binding transcriptional MerR regulator
MMLYRAAQAASLAGVSMAELRDFTAIYAPFFSEQATPPPGETRLFTAEDVRLLAFLADVTQRGATVEEVVRQLAGGALAEFPWWAPADDSDGADGASALAPVPQLQVIAQAFWMQAEESRRRESELRRRLEAAERRIEELECGLAALSRAMEHKQANGWTGVWDRVRNLRRRSSATASV